LEADCDESFAKQYQLRNHICTAHAPAGTKPYICTHPGCTKSFSTNQKLNAHSKVHEGTATSSSSLCHA
jgi:general transcription factor IIIA